MKLHATQSTRPIVAALLAAACLSLAACGNSAETDSGDAPATVDENLFAPGKFVAAADVYAADQAGVDVMFVDARTALDYEFGHIPGAVNVPYFEAEDHVDSLPKDRWIVTYCECPHAEAEQVADALLNNGYTLVRVIDEGLQGWRDVGGEVVAGAPSDS